jgi:predicted P-loop ATPase
MTPMHAHLRYHQSRRPELYKVFEEPLKIADEWARGDKNQIIPNHPQNIRHALELLGVEFRHNEFCNHLEVHARMQIQDNYGFFPSKDRFKEVSCDLAHASRYHPVKDYFATLKHDGAPRIDTWLIDYAGAENTPFNRAVGRLWLVAAVRRIMHPGAKFDTIPVFEGLQGKNKSTAMECLAVNEDWVTDDLPLGEKSKEVIEKTEGAWIVEFPDLTGMSRRELNQVKSFAARRKDRARLSYGWRATTVGRQWVGAATSNDTEYLSDDQNRRFWPVWVNRFDLEKLFANRDQLWAETVVAEARGESITLPETLWEAAAEVQAERKISNPFYEKLVGMLPAA